MIYSKENAGKWVASKDGKVIAVDEKLHDVLEKVPERDRDTIRLSLVPPGPYLAG